MMKTAIFFALCALASQFASSTAAPTDTEASEIAPYTVIKTTKNYEVRSYSPANWVCRDHMGTSFRNRDSALSFFDLFDYITGQNSEGAEIDMTAPVSMYTKANADGQGNTLYQMCFYVPEAHQANPPQPTASTVYMEQRPGFVVAARRFGGFMKRQSDWVVQMEALRSDLKADNELDFDFDNFYGATYDSPFKFTNRRNEIWLVKLQ